MAISGKTHTEAIYDIHPAEFLVDEINIQKFTVSSSVAIYVLRAMRAKWEKDDVSLKFEAYIMNAPDRFELFVIPEGKRKVEMEEDTKIPNAATFKIEREDHTLANMLRMQLLKDPRVLFAGYKVPHPLEHNFILKIQTAPDTTPENALGDAITELIQEIGQLKNKFEMDVIRQRAFEDAKATHGGGMDGDDMALDPHRAGLDVDF